MASELAELLRKRAHQGAWSNKKISAALSARRLSASESAVSKWLNDANGISRANLDALVDLLMPVPEPGCGIPDPDRARALELWQAMERAKVGRRAQSSPAVEDPPAEKATDWPRSNPKPFLDLAALELHTPRSDNQGGFFLHGRLDLAQREDDSTDPPIRLAMQEAFLRVEVTDNLVMDGSLIGKRAAHPNLSPAGDALRITGPRPDAQCLDGEVFEESHIVTITPTDDAAAEVTVTISVGRRAFTVTPLDEEGRPLATALDSEAKKAVLNALIFENLPRDGTGRAVLQQAKLRRRPKE